MNKEWDLYMKLRKSRPYEFRNTGDLRIIIDEEIIREFEEKNNVKIGVVYSSTYHLMVVDLVEDNLGNKFTYERLLPVVENGAVVVIPKIDDKFVLLKQYRHALRDYQFGLPRGFAKVEVSAEENAKKELEEELGSITVDLPKFLGTVIADS